MPLDLASIPETPTVPFHLLAVEQGFNVRTQYDDKEIKALAESIKEHGQNTPLKVHRNGGTKLIIDEGHRRYLAMQLLGWKSEPVKIDLAHFDTQAERYLANLVENENRQDVSTYDFAKRCAELSEGIALVVDGKPSGEVVKVDLKEIAKRTSKSLSHIQNLVRCYKNMTEDARAVWANGFVAGKKRQELPLAVVFELGKSEGGEPVAEEEQEKILGNYITKVQATMEETGGKRKRRSKKELAAANEDKPAAISEIRDALELFEARAKDDDAPKKGSVADAFLKGQIMALRYVTGEITLRGFQASSYK